MNNSLNSNANSMKMHLNTTNSPSKSCKSFRSIVLLFCLVAMFAGTTGAQPPTQGGNSDGTFLLNQRTSWTFTAPNGDRIVARIGALTATNFFNPWLRIYGPNGVLIGDSGGGGSEVAAELALTATN